MNNPDYRYLPKDIEEIAVSDFAFDFPEDLDPVWAPSNPVNKEAHW